MISSPVPKSSKPKMDFPRMARELRVSAGLRQREVAAAIGIKPSSYGNLESANHKNVQVDKVRRLARFYSLNPADTETLIAAWQAMPVSEFSARRKEGWDKRNELRAKGKRAGVLEIALVEVLGMLVPQFPDPESLCICEFGAAQPCEICAALQALGLTGWTTLDQVIRELAALQEKLAKPPAPVLPDGTHA